MKENLKICSDGDTRLNGNRFVGGATCPQVCRSILQIKRAFDITEIVLKVVLNIIQQTNKQHQSVTVNLSINCSRNYLDQY
jgi:hypothetical protein